MKILKYTQAMQLLNDPQFTQAQILSLTEPRLDSGLLQNWVNRGSLELNFEQQGRTRYYTGASVIAICAAQALRLVDVPLEVVNSIYNILSSRAVVLLSAGEQARSQKAALAIIPDKDGYSIQEVSKGKCPRSADAYVILESDEIIIRVLKGLLSMTD